MITEDSKNLWIYREAKQPSRMGRYILATLVVAGLISMIRLADWWFREMHVANLTLYIILSVVFWYGMLRIILICINYLGIRKPKKKTAHPGLRVAIFTTSSTG